MIVGTAGHIDHGKTSLVKALTGVDTDRLKEEKERGITIELGFAYWPRPGGETVGFVDVPGHERLVHTMLAGATGIDFVMLVIAADDGVMPQTREHLAILDLLGLTRGILVLTKCDLADAARRSDVEAEIRQLTAGTGLAGADILHVSATTGEGMTELASRLDRAVAETSRRDAAGRFRLAIDRVFSLAGAGTVVTGTVLSGRVSVGDSVIVSPSGLAARVRSIHAQNKSATSGVAGDRCALALTGPGISTESVRRGETVLDPSLHAPTTRIDVHLSMLRGEAKPIGQWTPIRLHHAACEIQGRAVVLRDKALNSGETDFVQLVLDSPLSAAAGDRFVLRDTSATRTIGGGTITDLRAPERKRRAVERRAELEALAEPDAKRALEKLLALPKGAADFSAFMRDRCINEASGSALAAAVQLVLLDTRRSNWALTREGWSRFSAALLKRLADYHREKPDLPGLGQERLRLALEPRLPAPVFSAALQKLVAAGSIKLDRAWARLPGHEVRFSPEEERFWQTIVPKISGAERFRPPRVRDIATSQSIDEAYVRRLFKLAGRRGDVEEVAKDHFFRYDTVVEMAEIARDLAASAEDGCFSVASFRDKLDNGRKVAIQILEFFDAQGLTMRRGDWRQINPHKRQLFAASSNDAEGGAMKDGGDALPVPPPYPKSIGAA